MKKRKHKRRVKENETRKRMIILGAAAAEKQRTCAQYCSHEKRATSNINHMAKEMNDLLDRLKLEESRRTNKEKW